MTGTATAELQAPTAVGSGDLLGVFMALEDYTFDVNLIMPVFASITFKY